MTREISKILNSREGIDNTELVRKRESEGGCGVIGLAGAEKIAGRHLVPALCQMKNRGNGKGGGVAAAGFSPKAFGVSHEILDNDYMVTIAYLDRSIQQQLENSFITPLFHVDHVYQIPSSTDVPEVLIYFVRVKRESIQEYIKKHLIHYYTENVIADELVYQNSYQLNRIFYAHSEIKKAFVLSHSKNLLVLKTVGFADTVIQNYQLENLEAHVWIGHHRYPTKGKVWHPGGAHPFVGMHEALVHNGDFANYSAMTEYLAQRNIHPLFLTDTEVSVLLFDLLIRTYNYPLEYVMEAMAPTTERDFDHLPKEKQEIYETIQKAHLHASPDGPWFFIIAQSYSYLFRLIGITDTSMLRPQVFALQTGTTSIGMIASEKQAIDALLLSLSDEDSRYWPRADFYWSCRGGSYTDGGAFTFTVHRLREDQHSLSCHNKFGQPFPWKATNSPSPWSKAPIASHTSFPDYPDLELYKWVCDKALTWTHEEAENCLASLLQSSDSAHGSERALYVYTKLVDLVFPLKKMRRSYFLSLVDKYTSLLIEKWAQRKTEEVILDARLFPGEGDNSLAREIVRKQKEGYKKFVIGNCRGHRFLATGLGPSVHGIEMDIYGSSGDYLASGIDGAIIRVHGSVQDQAAQIMKDGKLVIYGDVGQTFLYGAKGGVAYVRGSTAGRPLINAVGAAKLVLNGTSLDYFAESFMAGDPLRGGGFAIVNRVRFNEEGEIEDTNPPYPGNNLFSLASGGAIYIRDPEFQISEEQLNGGEFSEFSLLDQNLIAPYLEENAKLFGIPVARLLEMNGKTLTFQETYRKIVPAPTHLMDPEEAWVTTLANNKKKATNRKRA